jgi:hypothetical protein
MSTGQPVKQGIGVSARNEHTLLLEAMRVLPLDGNTMSGILAG